MMRHDEVRKNWSIGRDNKNCMTIANTIGLRKGGRKKETNFVCTPGREKGKKRKKFIYAPTHKQREEKVSVAPA